MNPLAVMLTLDEQIDRRILLEAESLQAVGIEVVIWAPHSKKALTTEIRGVPVRRNFALGDYFIRCLWKANGVLSRLVPPGNSWLARVKRFAWRHVIDKESFYRTRFAACSVGRVPQIVIAHDLQTLPAAYQVARAAQASLVYDSHELFCEQEFSAADKSFWSSVERKYVGKCDLVVTVNHSIAEELKRRYQLNSVDVIQNAERRLGPVRIERVFHGLFGIPEGHHVLLLQGGISVGRNIETLVQAMALVRNPAVHLVVLGDGPLVPHLKEIVAQMGLAARVYFHPAVAQKDLLRYTAAADAGVIPYQATCLNNYYCTPNKLFEFVAAGLPVVANDLPEIRRVISEHQIGILGPMASSQEVAELIDRLFSDTEVLAGYATSARVASEQLCWETEAVRYQALINSVLSRRPRAALAAAMPNEIAPAQKGQF